MKEEEAIKVINKRTERLLKELEVEKREDFSDEPKIAYLMQEIRANKTLLNLIETQKAELEEREKAMNLMAEQLTTPINDKKWVIEYYTKLAEEEKKDE